MYNGNVVTQPTIAFHTVERAICHCSSHSHVGINLAYQIYRDNLAIVQMWKAKDPRDKQLVVLCHTIFFIATQNHFKLAIHHLSGTHNPIADALSRQQVQRFRSLIPEAEASPKHIPAWLTEV